VLPAKLFGRSRRQSLLVFIGARHVEWGTSMDMQASPLRLQRRLLDQEVDGNAALQALLVVVGQIVPAHGGHAIHDMRVVVADSWLASTTVPWSAAMFHEESALHCAREQLVANGYGLDGADHLRLDNTGYGAPRLAFSYPDTLLSSLHQCASRLQVRLRSVQPLSSASWSAVRRRYGRQHPTPQALLIVDESLLIVVQSGHAGASRMRDVTVRRRAAQGCLQNEELRDAWQRLSLRQPHLCKTQEVPVLDMTVQSDMAIEVNRPFVRFDPGMPHIAQLSPLLLLSATRHGPHHALDAVSYVPPVTSWRWAILFSVALLTGVLTIQAIRTRAGVVTLTSRLESLRSAGEMRRQSDAARSLWRREELPRVRAVNAAIRQLNLPISLILRALVPPADMRVAVLSVETAGNGSRASNGDETGNAIASHRQMLSIVAEAASSADMARYVAFLDERKPFVRAYLTRHEIDAASAERPYRFSVELPWAE
jgi:hypothetical protein